LAAEAERSGCGAPGTHRRREARRGHGALGARLRRDNGRRHQGAMSRSRRAGARWPLEDRVGWSVLGVGGALGWTAIALLGGMAAVNWVLGVGGWLTLVVIGGMTGDGR
jgi:hypothetical protein